MSTLILKDTLKDLFRNKKERAEQPEEGKGQNTVKTKGDHFRNSKFAMTIGENR